jgi:hypothetical protein
MSSPLRLLLGARGLRNFGDGFVAVLLPVYLKALGFSPLEVGALAGTARSARPCSLWQLASLAFVTTIDCC